MGIVSYQAARERRLPSAGRLLPFVRQHLVETGGTLLASGGSSCSTGSRTPCKTSTAARASRWTPPILGTSTSLGGCLVAWRAMGRPQVNGPGQNVGAHESDRAPEIGREIDARSTCANRPSQAETDSGFSRSDFGSWTIARSLREARPFLLIHLGTWTAIP
jgi:hypothetical protein